MDQPLKRSRSIRPARNPAFKGATTGPREPFISASVLTAICVLIILVSVFSTFSSVCENEFAGFDDGITLYDNPRMKPLPPLTVLQSASWYWRHSEAGLYTPLTQQVWAMLVMLASNGRPTADPDWLRPGIFHAANLIVHCGTAVMAFAVLRRLVKNDFAALAGALFYGVHPFQTECVGWASGLKDVLAGFFGLASLWQYLIFASLDDIKTGSTPVRRWIHFGLAALLLLMGELSKTSAMMIPVLALTIDRLILKRPWRRIVLPVGALLLIIAPLVLVAKIAQDSVLGVQYVFPLWQHPLIATDALAFYLYKLFVPIHFLPDYGRNPTTALRHGWLWWTWILPVTLAFAIYHARKSRPWLAAGGLFMAISLAPVLGLTTFGYEAISSVADHYMYIALLGPAMVLAFALLEFAGKWNSFAVYGAVGVILFFLAADSSMQIRFWHDPFTLWSHAVEVAPDGFASRARLSWIYQKQGPQSYDKAYEQLQVAMELAPDNWSVHNDLAILLVLMHRPNEAATHIKQAFDIQDGGNYHPLPGSEQYRDMVKNRSELAQYMLNQNRLTEAVEYFQRALALDPTYQPAVTGLAEAKRRINAVRR